MMAARLQMARSRQQMLASMVVLGINRIVVTDGAINAKVLFELKASDQAARRARASLYDAQSSMNRNVSAGGVNFGWGAAGTTNVNERPRHITTVSSSVDESSESKAELKAKLSGEVRVNFKSDYFPMEKLASPGMIASIQGNATPSIPSAARGRCEPGAGARRGGACLMEPAAPWPRRLWCAPAPTKRHCSAPYRARSGCSLGTRRRAHSPTWATSRCPTSMRRRPPRMTPRCSHPSARSTSRTSSSKRACCEPRN